VHLGGEAEDLRLLEDRQDVRVLGEVVLRRLGSRLTLGRGGLRCDRRESVSSSGSPTEPSAGLRFSSVLRFFEKYCDFSTSKSARPTIEWYTWIVLWSVDALVCAAMSPAKRLTVMPSLPSCSWMRVTTSFERGCGSASLKVSVSFSPSFTDAVGAELPAGLVEQRRRLLRSYV
jgi:hypothetical protein